MGSQCAGARQQPKGMAPFRSDPKGRTRSLWPKLSPVNMHCWYRPAELGRLMGNLRGFGFASN